MKILGQDTSPAGPPRPCSEVLVTGMSWCRRRCWLTFPGSREELWGHRGDWLMSRVSWGCWDGAGVMVTQWAGGTLQYSPPEGLRKP